MQSLANTPMTGGSPHKVAGFYPYADNGGTLAAIAGDGFVVIGADTRLTSGYSIFSREASKLTKLTDKTVIGSCGCWCDSLTFTKGLHIRLQYYLYENNKPISTNATAQLVSNMLYQKRFFPYYVSTIVAGLDADNQGAVYAYDPVGSTERLRYRAQGTAGSLIQPFLDCVLQRDNQTAPEPEKLTKDQATIYLKDAFMSAAEREIGCGDFLQIMIVTPQGVEEERFKLRKD